MGIQAWILSKLGLSRVKVTLECEPLESIMPDTLICRSCGQYTSFTYNGHVDAEGTLHLYFEEAIEEPFCTNDKCPSQRRGEHE